MLQVTMVTPSLGVGGAERWIIDLIKSTSNEISWNVVISGWGQIDRCLLDELLQLCVVYGNRPVIKLKDIIIPLVDNDYEGITITGSDLRESIEIASSSSDIIVTWAIPDIGVLVGDFKGPIIYVSHTDVKSPVDIIGHTHQVGVSKQSLNHFLNHKKPTKVIWNGADPRCGTDEQTWNIVKEWRGREPVVGQIGRHVPLKQYMLTAHAVSISDHLMLVNYGATPDGSICQELQSFCNDHIKHFYLSKPIKMIGSAIMNFDTIVMPSLQEANSLAVIEAMLCRVPIISTNVGAIPEFEEQFGDMIYKIDVNINPQLLNTKILNILDEHNAERIENNYKIAKEHMTIEAAGKRWVNYMNSL